MQPVSQESGQPSSSPGNDWPLKRLRYLIAFNPTKAEVSSAPQDREVSFVPMESIGEHGGLDLDIAKPLADVMNGYTYFRDGDVLVAKITPCFENYKGALAADLTNGLGFGTTELHVLRPGAELTGRYLFYLTMSHRFRELGESYMYGAGGQKRVPAAFIEDLVHPIPPLPEQRAIANFLDRKTAEIDALLEEKQRLLELLEERRSALITQAVTKGLDPDVEMKDSGVEWLGEIPARWDVVQLKYVSVLQTGLTLGKQYEGRNLISRPYLRVANVQAGHLDLSNVSTIDIPRSDAHRYELQLGDVLLTEGGDFDKLGRGCVWENQIPGCLHQNHIFAVRPYKQRLSPYFLAAVLEGGYGRTYFTATAKQSTNLASTNSTKVRAFPVPLPPICEQAEILENLRRMLAELANLREMIHTAINHLHEYRTALISAAVTGKIDVREEAA